MGKLVDDFEVLWEEKSQDPDKRASDLPEDLEAIYEESFHAFDHSIVPGTKTTGTIIQLSPDRKDVLVQIDHKVTGSIEKFELMDDQNQLLVREGDTIDVYVTKILNGEAVLTKSLSKAKNSYESMKEAQLHGFPVKGTVLKQQKSGFTVQVFDKQAFCPISHIDQQIQTDHAAYIGKTYDFLIIRVERHNLVISRRKFLDQLTNLTITRLLKDGLDKIYQGKVVDVRDFGAFVEFENVKGFVHKSEIKYGYVSNATEYLLTDQVVSVKLLSIEKKDDGKHRIHLSIKQGGKDPWENIEQTFSTGELYPGKITKLLERGAFTSLTPDIEGFIPISEMSWLKNIQRPKDILSLGDSVSVRVLSIDVLKRRIVLSLKDLKKDPWIDVKQNFQLNTLHRGTVERLNSFGAVVQLREGIEGFLPISIIKKLYGAFYRKQCSPPQEIDVKILKIDNNHQKILLGFSATSADEEAEKDFLWYQELKQEKQLLDKKNPKNEVGSFGELLQKSLCKSVNKS